MAITNRNSRRKHVQLEIHAGLIDALLDCGDGSGDSSALDDILSTRSLPARLVPELLSRAQCIIDNEEPSDIRELAALLHDLCCRAYR